MATLDMNADLLLKNGPALFERWAENIRWFYEKAQDIKGLRLMRADGLDPTKINLDMSYWGFDGERLEKFLIQKGIYPELVSGNIVMCMSGIGNKREDYEDVYKRQCLNMVYRRTVPAYIFRRSQSSITPKWT